VSGDPEEASRRPQREALVANYLEGRSRELAGLYAHARRLTRERAPDGWIYLVGHAGRELMNRLADYEPVPIEDPDRKRGRTGTERYAERLRAARESGEAAELEAAADWVVEDVERGRKATASRAEALLGADAQGGEGETAAWVSQWRRVQRAIVGFAHVPSPNSPPREADELIRAFDELTDLLAVRVAQEPFFDSFDELIELAHAPDPDLELARGALARLREGTAARFYAELQSPKWVDLLAELEVFAREPTPLQRDGDWISFPPWPEGQVLLRFAGSAPDAVAAAARSVPESENAAVANVLAETALLLPAPLVSGVLARRVAADLKGSARLLGLPITAGKLVSHLARGGRGAGALTILASLLEIDVRTEESDADFLPARSVGHFVNDTYEVTEAAQGALPDLLAADSLRTFKKLVKQLRWAQECLAYGDSTAWRDAISGPDERGEFELRQLLLQLVRDTGVHIVDEGEGAFEVALAVLEAEESKIFVRLRAHLLAGSTLAASRAPELLGDPEVLFDFHSRPEVVELLGAAWPGLDAAERVKLLEAIGAGPDPARLGIDPEADAEKARSYGDDWRLELLGAMDGELDAEHQLWLEALRAARGPFSPLPPSGWIGPESPSSPAELAAMDPETLIDHLRDFRPERHFMAPSREGLGRELAEAIGADPEHYEALGARLDELPWIHVRAALQGFDKALKKDWKPADDRVLAALESTQSRAREATEPGPELAAAELIGTEVLQSLLRGDPPAAQRERIFALIELVAADSDPSPDRDAGAEEPLGLAINSVRGRAVELAAEYLGWLHRSGEIGWDAAPEARGLLDRLAADPARAVRAMLGAHLAGLAAVGIDWVAEHRGEVADPGGEDPARAGWDAYLGHGGIFGDLVEVLAESYREAIARLASEPPAEEQTRSSLAEHVAVIWRDLEPRAPGLLDAFLSQGEDGDRARLVGTLGRALRPGGEGDYEPDAADLERHRELWSARLAVEDLGVAEAEEFGWFWTSGRFETAEDVERLALTLQRAGGKLEDARAAIRLLAERLGHDAALAAPAMAVLEAIAEARSAGPQHLQVAHLQSILEVGLRESISTERARALIHSYGEQGFIQLRALLD
jgi:hypothetical protein